MASVSFARCGLLLTITTSCGTPFVIFREARLECSLVGLRSVLSGIDYIAKDGERQCSFHKSGEFIEARLESSRHFEAFMRIEFDEFADGIDRLLGRSKAA